MEKKGKNYGRNIGLRNGTIEEGKKEKEKRRSKEEEDERGNNREAK